MSRARWVSTWSTARWRLAGAVLCVLGIATAAKWISRAADLREDAMYRASSLRNDLSLKHERSANFEAYRAQVAEIKDQLVVVLRYLPSRIDDVEVGKDVSVYARKNGLRVAELVRGEEIQREFYAMRDYRLAMSGPFSAVLGFVNDLGASAPLRSIQELRLRTEGAAPGEVQAEINLRYYRYLDEDESVDEAAP